MKWKNFTCLFYKNNEEIYQNTFINKAKNNKELQFNMLDFDTIINLEKETFLRENNEYMFYLDIKNNICKIELKKEELTFDINVEEASMEVLNDKIILEYFIETDEARNKIIINERTDFNE